MAKYRYGLLMLGWLLLAGCQSIEHMSIDYMIPAEVSFPSSLKRVAVVNNMPNVPDKKLLGNKENETGINEVISVTSYYYGDDTITTEALATALANENYFDEVIICDSALRSTDIFQRQSALTQEEVNQLTRSLNTDFLIALENIQIETTRKVCYAPELGAFRGTIDAKAYPTVRVYLPNRNGPMVTITGNDSIYWEEIGYSEVSAATRLINEKEMLEQVSEFAGSIPVKLLLPYWRTGSRYLFTGGSINMRDAAVYAKEENWKKAIELWEQTYSSKKNKQKMYAAYNIALGYEMQDELDTAIEWAQKARAVAQERNKDGKVEMTRINNRLISYDGFISMYVDELQRRRDGISRLNMQMNRFDDDF